MRSAVAMVCLLGLGCTSSWGISHKGFCAHLTAIDVRIGEKYCLAGDVELGQDKEAMSKQHAEMLEKILPDIVKAGVEAGLAAAGIGAASSIIEACPVPLDIFKKEEDEEPVAAEKVEPEKEKKRRTPEEKDAARRARGDG